MAQAERKKDLKVFDEELKQLHIGGQWKYEELLIKSIGGPHPRGDPYIWKWDTVYPKLLEACEALPESLTARRSLLFENPGVTTSRGTTHTLLMGIQIIRPGEVAWAHRHTPAAIRFVIKGDGKVCTVVEGELCPMENYDLILTPQWTWHDHRNPTSNTTIWLDALDVPLILGLNTPFYEPYPGDRVQTLKEDDDYLQVRSGGVRPTWENPKKENFPMRYRWKDTETQLKALGKTPGSAYDGISLEYVNPMTGGPTLPTMSCWIQMLRPGERTKRHRHTSSAMYFVVRGEGTTLVGEEALEWGQHDSFAIPNWAWHEHVNRSATEEAILFSVNDIPVLQALRLYREEPENSLRTVAASRIPVKTHKTTL